MSSSDRPKFTRKHWLFCTLIAVAVFGINHYLSVSGGRYYPIVVWGAPIFFLVGLVGLFKPGISEKSWEFIVAAVAGLAIGLALHHFLYGF